MATLIQNIGTSISTAYKKLPGLNRKGDSGNKGIAAIQLARLKVDVQKWRESIAEAERAYFPFRYKQQQIFVDTVLNGHTKACWDRRKDLTLLRSFKICRQVPDVASMARSGGRLMSDRHTIEISGSRPSPG